MVPHGAAYTSLYHAIWCHMVPNGAKGCQMVPHGAAYTGLCRAIWCQMVPKDATWCHMVPLPCHMVPYGAQWCHMVPHVRRNCSKKLCSVTLRSAARHSAPPVALKMTFEVTFEETVQKNGARRHFTLLHFTLLCHAPCMDMHGSTLVSIYIYIFPPPPPGEYIYIYIYINFNIYIYTYIRSWDRQDLSLEQDFGIGKTCP